MACMKCGKETRDGQLFCARCLEGMEAYPIKSDAHVQLPARSREQTIKKQPRKVRQKEVSAARLQLQIRWMWVVIIALLLALAVSLGRDAVIREVEKLGQNYTYNDPAT